MSWIERPFGDVFRFRNGKSIKPGLCGEFLAYGSNGPIGRAQDWMYQNAIIVGRVGAYCGSVAYCPDRFWASDNTIVVEPNHNLMDVSFSYYFLKNADLNRHAGGAAQPLVTQGTLKPLRAMFPSLPIQRRIAGILSAYDDLIENNTRRIAILEDMARRLFEEWFVKVDVEQDGWERATLGNWVTELRDAIDPNAIDAETPYVGLEHLPRRSTTMSDWGKAASVGSTKLRFERGDVLFGKIRPYFHKVAVAPKPGVASSDAIVMRPHTPACLPAVLCLTSSDEFVAYATQTSNGTKMPRAQWPVLKEYALPRPPQHLLASFNASIEPSIWLCASLAEQNATLRATRDLLLPKLISGEIDVSRGDADAIPASELAVAAE